MAFGPKMFVVNQVVLDEFEIEKGVIVNQLEDGIFAFHADAMVFAYESATFQVFQYGGQFSVASFFPQIHQLVAGHDDFLFPQQVDDADIRLRMVEKRSVQLGELVAEFAIAGKKQPVDVLRQRFPTLQFRPIVGGCRP